jgi:hypothetical protein
LNTTGSHELKSVVENTLSVRGDDPSDIYVNDVSGAPHTKGISSENKSSPQRSQTPPPMTISFNKADLTESSPLATSRKKILPQSGPPPTAAPVAPPNPNKRTSSAQQTKAARRLSSMYGRRRAGFRQILQEWDEEEEVRREYDLPPPDEVLLVDDDDDDEEAAEKVTQSQRRRITRPSMMNRVTNLASMRALIERETIDSPDSSIGDDQSMEENDRLLGRIEGGNNRRPVDIESPRVASERAWLLPSGRSNGTPDVLNGRKSDRG